MPKGIPPDIKERIKKAHSGGKNGGRKKIPIDWKKVGNLAVHGASGVQIASQLGICKHTLYDRCKIDLKMDFSAFWYEQWEKGNAQIHAKQFQKAMSGDNTLLVWLGKNRLKQTDKIDSTIDGKIEVSQKAILEIPDNGRRKKE